VSQKTDADTWRGKRIKKANPPLKDTTKITKKKYITWKERKFNGFRNWHSVIKCGYDKHLEYNDDEESKTIWGST
jgi:hypothetical protein